MNITSAYVPRAKRRELVETEVKSETNNSSKNPNQKSSQDSSQELVSVQVYDNLKLRLQSDQELARRILDSKNESMKRWMCDFRTWHRVGPIETTVNGTGRKKLTHTHGLKFLRLGKFDTLVKEVSGNPFESLFVACLYKDGEPASAVVMTDRFNLYNVNEARNFYHHLKDIDVEYQVGTFEQVMLHWFNNDYRAY